MKLQRYEEENEKIRIAFEALKKAEPERFARRMSISFSSPCFGLEPAVASIERLAALGYEYIELPGNYGGCYSGHHVHTQEIQQALADNNMQCSGVSPFTLSGYSLSEKDFFNKQKAFEYAYENLAFCKAVGGSYYLVTPTPLGQSNPSDSGEYARSVQTLREMAPRFEAMGIKCAIEPCCREGIAFCHNVEETQQYIRDVNHPGVGYIYGDLKHFSRGERHIGEAIIRSGDQLLCMHLRDTINSMAIGNGMMDVDTVIRALYLIGFNEPGRYVVGEPNPGAYSKHGGFDPFIPYPEDIKLAMAEETITYFKEREDAVLGL